MSPDKRPPAGRDETPTSTHRKTSRPQEPSLRCPRCDSPNTKFCYYNNYSLTQPRHFCKTCRRYWTKGGALRSVPIGGSCRKNKKSRTSPPPSGDDTSDGLKFFKGVAPAMDFQLNFPATSLLNNHFDNSSNISTAISLNPCYAFDPSAAPLIGFDLSGNNPPPNPELGFRSSLASSMESLSCINQDLHWKLQKQRLAMLSPADNNNQKTVKPQPILFQDLEVPSSCGIKAPRKIDDGGNLSTEWFFDNTSYSYGGNAAATSNGVNGDNGSGWSNGIQAWNDLSHYSSIP